MKMLPSIAYCGVLLLGRTADVRTLSLDFAQADGELARHPLPDKADLDDFVARRTVQAKTVYGDRAKPAKCKK